MWNIRYIIVFLVVFAMSCGTDETEQEEVLLTEVNISLDSTKFQHVYNLIDRWQQDSLLAFVTHRDPSFRVLAIGGFAGMMDEAYIDQIGQTILDPIVEVRRISAFVLGQSRHSRALPFLMQIFQQQDSLGIDPLTFKYALEGVGKCADSSYLSLLAGISTYRPQDTLLLEGQALGILNLAERGYSNPLATNLMMRYATSDTFPPSVRLIAANYLDVARGLDLSTFRDALTSAFEANEDPAIRMFLGKAIGKTGAAAAPWIRGAIRNEEDARVRVSLLQGCTALPLHLRHGIWSASLRDQNERVAMTAGDLIMNYGSTAFSETYVNWAFSNFNPRVYARILAAGNKFVTNTRFLDMIGELIIQRIRATSDPYVKSEFIRAAGQQWATARQLIEFDGDDEPPIIRTAIMEAMVDAVRRTESIGNRERDYLIERWKTGDVAALSMLSPLFSDYPNLFATISSDTELWEKTTRSIPMPQGIEGRIAVEKARSKLFDHSFDPEFYRRPEVHTHPIDWDLYGKLSDQPRAEISTASGTMTLKLFKTHAPGTVVNFIKLAESGYYEGRPIHRLVPNFVIQGGGNRGDGYGSLDYTIRSEVGPKYFDRAGLIGMASAGLHTESQQWFITLRPALHLNGRYTIFGELTSGNETLLDIRQGDVIQNIKITR